MTYYHGRREYPTLQKLFKGEIVELGGIRFMKDEGDLKSGDLYIAERNTGPKLLTVKRVDLDYGMVVPMTFEYCYDVGECIKVKEASLSTTSCPSSEEPKKAKLSPPPVGW